MKNSLSLLLLSSLILAACNEAAPLPVDSGTPDPVEQPAAPTKETQLEVAYIAVSDNGASGPLVGCGDSEILTEVSVNGDLNAKQRITAALENLFNNKEQFMDGSGLYNALYQSTLTVDSVVINDGTVTVELSGATQLGGECDDPRFVEQIKGTVENNLDSEKTFTTTINLNGKPLEKIQDLSDR